MKSSGWRDPKNLKRGFFLRVPRRLKSLHWRGPGRPKSETRKVQVPWDIQTLGCLLVMYRHYNKKCTDVRGGFKSNPASHYKGAEDGTEFFRKLSQEYFWTKEVDIRNRRLPFLREEKIIVQKENCSTKKSQYQHDFQQTGLPSSQLGINSLWRSPGSAEKNSAGMLSQGLKQ
ncbi:uncharacterized protein LOC101747896 isoform X1 [Gallus gallus]|uniref:uncharacterized protein LOC101747896 isoform X1 n=1 Tax=Gallus gallus TaxID=9031 RepID=UPI001AE6163E|nr:uncharacterized protein LOC101747896 isoform X1 [Gallus gallus]